MMSTIKRKQSNTEISDDGPRARRASNVLGYNAHSPWLQDSIFSASRRSVGNRAHAPSLPLANMVTTVQELIDPDFDPLIAILDEEPRFLKPLPDRVPPEDLEFLRFRGALSIPESGLRTELLRCYIKWVHSFLPLLDLQEFLRCIAENDPNGNISLLLFQAVMFVATAFIDFKHLQSAGYTTRKSARNAFYTRLRLLYSLDCEDDRIVIVQTLLLMTYWSDHMNSPQRDIWDWIGICSTHAHSIGLNRDPSFSDMDKRTKQVRARLWWCLFSRDRLIAMGLRRPTQVNEGTSNLPMLRLEDFDFDPFHPAVIEQFRCRQLEDSTHQKRLATMFIEKTKLCQCIGRVLFAQYTPSQYQFGMTNRTTINLVPRHASESELSRCSQLLESWLTALPKDVQFIPASRSNFSDGEDVLLLHGAMVRMLYHATISTLHRPWAFGLAKDQTNSSLRLANIARNKIHEAAIGITHIIQGLNKLNLTRYLPQSGVTVILPAAVAHLANSMSNDPTLRERSINNFQQCIQVLQGLKDIYPAADMEVANIEAAVKAHPESTNALLQIMQVNSPAAPSQSQDAPRQPSSTSNPPIPRNNTSSSSEGAHVPNQWTPPSEETDPATKSSTRQLDFETPLAQQTSPTNPPLKNSTVNAPQTHPKQVQPTLPDDFTDLLQFDVDMVTSTFSPPDPNPPGAAEFELDWTTELLQWVDANPEYYSSVTADAPKDLFSFAARRDQSPPPGYRYSHAGGNITGDLDRDLGLTCSGDEMY
ncbi:hypothetical protein ARAM_005258 [Aspergillus rambellii]|uniref:Xylanolytic transcriptional activator regulatory domain-containing protein n=1 Tax=Aspergillus rambellii TaxID=308745 RepID=A0A0F8WQM8_9EURO|nr:hypothetical protein ARAM_005258 [Aspergillus rambellii]